MSENGTVVRLLSIGFVSMLLLTLFAAPDASAASVTTLEISAPKYGTSPTFVTHWTEFTLTALPTANIWYQWAGYNYTAYTGAFTASVEYPSTGAPIPPTDLDGLQTLYYNSTDALGLNESPKSVQVFVDSYYPVTSLGYIGEHYTGTVEFIVPDTKITLTAEDAGSGVADTYYRIDDGQNILYSAPFAITAPGDHTLYYYTVDNLQNTEPERTVNLFVDTDPPGIQITPHQPFVEIGSQFYVGPNTLFELGTSDTSGGVDTSYMIDGGTWTTYSVPFSVSGTGDHTITAKAVDSFGQMSETSLAVYVDSTPPQVSMNGTIGTIIEIKTGDYIELLATDSGVGQCTIFYSLNQGETWTPYAGPMKVTGSMTFMYYAEDGLGNVAASVTVQVTALPSGPSLMTILMAAWLIIGCIALVILYVLYRRKPKDAEKEEKKSNTGKEEEKPKKRKIKRNN